MENNYNLLLDQFNIKEYITTQDIKNSLSSCNHTDSIKLIKNFGIAKPYDYLRSCGENNFTDFPSNKLKRVVQEDSKYIIARNINNKVCYFYINNLIELVEGMDWLIHKGYFDSITSNTNKIKGYFKSETELEIGKKSTGILKFILEPANINSIVTRKYYLCDKNHLAIQSQLSALGVHLGYSSKLARGDKNKEIFGLNLSSIFTLNMLDLNLNNLYCGKSIEKIDYIDVIWVHPTNKLCNVAIEVEFSKDFTDALIRLSSLSYSSFKPNPLINIILTDKVEDYHIIKQYYKMPIFKNSFPHGKLAHLVLQDFLSVLALRNQCISPKLLEKYFFGKLRYL